jgi:DNA-binding HxlR family transcriptional regulator
VSDLEHTLPECPAARFLAVLDGPWATLIVRDLLTGPKRFTELRTGLPRRLRSSNTAAVTGRV